MNCPRCGDYMLDRKNAEPFCNRCNYETAAARGDVVTVTNCPHGRDGRHCRECDPAHECNVCPELLPNPSNCPQPCKRCGGPRTPIEGAPSVLECAACTALLNAKRPNCPHDYRIAGEARPEECPLCALAKPLNCPHARIEPAGLRVRDDVRCTDCGVVIPVKLSHMAAAVAQLFTPIPLDVPWVRLDAAAWMLTSLALEAKALDGEAGPSGAPTEPAPPDSEEKNGK